MYHYGRPKSQHDSTTDKTTGRSASLVLTLGCAMLCGFFLHTLVPDHNPQQTAVPEGYTAVMTTVPLEETIPEQVTTPDREDTGAEPFGYLDGEWNLWEYIGDLMVSLLS